MNMLFLYDFIVDMEHCFDCFLYLKLLETLIIITYLTDTTFIQLTICLIHIRVNPQNN